MSLFGVELNSQINRLITEVRLTLQKQKFIPNVRTLYRSFAQLDPEVRGEVTPQQFEKALGENGLFFKKYQIQVFEKAFTNGQGKIGWFQFLQLVRLPLNDKRKQVVVSIYGFLSNKIGELTPQNIVKQFNPDGIEIYRNGKVTKDYILQQLISLLSIPEKTLTQQQFVAFYDDLNVNFPHDEPFIKYVSQQWDYSSTSDNFITQQALKEIIKALRFKLIQKSKGTNDEFLLKKLFNEFDENKNGYISPYELDLMLKKLELPIPEQAVEPLFRKLDKNSSNYIEYDEFKRFLFFDPFPV